MSIITAGIDLAKSVFAVDGVDDNGEPVLVKPNVSLEHLLPLFAKLPPCLIGKEAYSGALISHDDQANASRSKELEQSVASFR